MADRSSASVFGEVFRLLASGKEPHLIARALWKMSFGYDFTRDQMDCDKALIKLGLARKAKATEEVHYADGTTGEETYNTVQYKERDGKLWEEWEEEEEP